MRSRRHQDNWLAAIAASDPSRLNAEIHEGHLSSSLCHMGGISHQLGKPAPNGRDHGAIAANDLLANSFDRMAGHLRANGVDIDGGDGVVTLGRGSTLIRQPKSSSITARQVTSAPAAASAMAMPCPTLKVPPQKLRQRAKSRGATAGLPSSVLGPYLAACSRNSAGNFFSVGNRLLASYANPSYHRALDHCQSIARFTKPRRAGLL